jgi:hypothetical protein
MRASLSFGLRPSLGLAAVTNGHLPSASYGLTPVINGHLWLFAPFIISNHNDLVTTSDSEA